MKYTRDVYEAVIEWYDNKITEKDVDDMDRRDVLSAYLNWEGIIGYTYIILDILDQ